MTVSLAYDPVLSRIRITADGLATAEYVDIERSVDQIKWKPVRGGVRVPVTPLSEVVDTFTRSVSNGWGTADTGQAWTIEGGAATDYGANGSAAWHDAQFEAATRRSLMAGPADGECTFTCSTPEVSSGEAAQANFIVREDGTNNNFLIFRVLFFPSTELELRISIREAGVETTIANPAGTQGTYGAGTLVHCRCRWQGAHLAMKVWTGTNPEPVGWQAEAVDDTFLAAGRMGFRSSLGTDWALWTGTVPLRISYHDFAAGPIAVKLDDYEFAADRTNYYRVRGYYDTVTQPASAPSATHADNTSVAAVLPEIVYPDDLVMVLAAIRSSGTGTPNTPAGYTLLGNAENLRLFGKAAVAGEPDPTVSFTGGAAGDTCSAQAVVLRGLTTGIGAGPQTQLNASAVDIAYPALAVGADGLTVLYAGWRQDDWASGGADVSTPAGFTEIGEPRTTTGNDQGMVWGHQVQTVRASIAAGVLDVGAGGPAISRAVLLALTPQEFLNEQTASMYPQLEGIWLKSVMRSFLNRTWSMLFPGGDEIGRGSRGADFPVKSRTLPIAVTEVGGARTLALIVRTTSREDTRWLDYVIAAGDVVFLHTPADCPVPTLYARIDATNVRRINPSGQVWHTIIPIRECAAPGPDIVTATATWDTLIAQYGSFDALAAEFATFDELLELIGDPSEVIVE